MPLRRNQIIIIGGAILIIVLFIVIFYFFQKGTRTAINCQIEFWSPIDSRQIYQETFDDFSKASKGFEIRYTQKSSDNYEKELVDALASKQGPDVFLIPNTWLPKHFNKIYPLPATIMDLRTFQDTFVDVASRDFVRENQIYAFPLYVDTLALLYNKDMMANAGIAVPPATWDEFQKDAKRMTRISSLGNIDKSGAAMGTWGDRYRNGNINRAPDILYLLMLQTGTQMVLTDLSGAAFDRPRESIYTGLEALKFYTGFANSASPYYSWNNQFHYSIDAFAEGNLGMMLTYAYNIPLIKAKNPHLNFGVAPAPQAQAATLNYANYYGIAVAKQSKCPESSWYFAKFFASPGHVYKYLNTAQRPTAARQLVDQQKSYPEIGVFAEQALTARSWYQIDPPAIETIFNSMIESVVTGRTAPDVAIRQAASDVGLLMGSR